MFYKNLETLAEEDLLSLIENSIMERKELEYKSSLPGNSDEEKKEYLADVTSFANADGGVIIFGMRCENGIPISLDGIEVKNVDNEMSRLENLIRDGIDPRIIGINIRPLKLSNSNFAILMKIPKSWIPPHRVIFKGYDKFFLRNSNGKYQMSVSELRIAFNFMNTINERIRKFREERIIKILSDDTPFPLCSKAKIVLHLIPFESFIPEKICDLERISSNFYLVKLLSGSPNNGRFNFDGYIAYSLTDKNKFDSYIQFFKNGITEAVDCSILNQKLADKTFVIYANLFEKNIINVLLNSISNYKKLDISPPIAISLSLLNVKGYIIWRNLPTFSITMGEHFPIERENLIIPEVLLGNFKIPAEKVLRQCFDAVWNACGYPRSLNYNENGEWIAGN